MANTGVISPVNASGSFSNVTNVLADDMNYAGSTILTEVVYTYNYGFSIASDSTINGIIVHCKGIAGATEPSNGDGARMAISLSVNGGVDYTAVKNANFGLTESTIDAGGATNIWGLTSPTGADFTNTNFRCRSVLSAWIGTGDVISINWIPITIYYTDVASPTVIQQVNHVLFFAGD